MNNGVPAVQWIARYVLQLRMEKARLATLREEHKVAEASLSKIKKRAAQDVESVINEYDQDLGSKEEEYQEVRMKGSFSTSCWMIRGLLRISCRPIQNTRKCCRNSRCSQRSIMPCIGNAQSLKSRRGDWLRKNRDRA